MGSQKGKKGTKRGTNLFSCEPFLSQAAKTKARTNPWRGHPVRHHPLCLVSRTSLSLTLIQGGTSLPPPKFIGRPCWELIYYSRPGAPIRKICVLCRNYLKTLALLGEENLLSGRDTIVFKLNLDNNRLTIKLSRMEGSPIEEISTCILPFANSSSPACSASLYLQLTATP